MKLSGSLACRFKVKLHSLRNVTTTLYHYVIILSEHSFLQERAYTSVENQP